MVRTGHPVDHRNVHRNKRNGEDAALKLEAPFDLSLYTPKYMRADPSAKNLRDGDNAWARLLEARPLMYLPDQSPITEVDPIDHRRRLWTHQQLQSFGDVVEERTRVQLLAQERTLRRWHRAAINIQRSFRGMRDRILVLRIRQEQFEYATTLEKAMELARLQRTQRKAAAAIQRVYKQHRKLVTHRERAALALQRANKLSMHRLRRWQSRLTIQRAARCYLWRLRWQQYRSLVAKMLKAAVRRQQLVLATKAFQQAREAALLRRQAQTWAGHPERLQILLLARRRKQELRDSDIGGFPPLSVPAKHRAKLRSPKQQNQQLPRIRSSVRGEYSHPCITTFGEISIAANTSKWNAGNTEN